MLKTKEKQQEIDTDDATKKREELIKKLEKRYYYNETIENGRIVLSREDLGLKFVQVIDTQEDREKYKQVMDNYLQYVKSHYDSGIGLEYDFESLFQIEILDNKDKRLPMFFVYRNGILAGTAGFRFYFEITDSNGKKRAYNEQSIRLTLIKKNPYVIIGRCGVYSASIAYLYALKRGSHIITVAYSCLRDLIFHFSTISGYEYINSLFLQVEYSNKKIKYDLFVNEYKAMEQNKEKIISFYLSKFNATLE